MVLNKQKLQLLIHQAKREKLIQYLDACLEQMTAQQLDWVFGDLYYEQLVQKMSPEEVLDQIKKFLKESLAGKYYAPFKMNSQNYDWVPPETDAWYSRLSGWLDRSCEIVQAGNTKIGKQCLDICLQLMEKQYDDDTIFAHDLGDWMIHSKYDYEAIYKGLK